MKKTKKADSSADQRLRKPSGKTRPQLPHKSPVKAADGVAGREASGGLGWTFLSNHLHVLLCLYRQPEMRIREVAEAVGITERMVQKVIAELVEAEFLEVDKQGRRNHYKIRTSKPLRHPLEAHCKIGNLLEQLSR